VCPGRTRLDFETTKNSRLDSDFMNTKTAYNHLTRLQSRLASIYSTAKSYGPTCDELISQTSVVHNDEALKRCPAWVRQSLQNQCSHEFHVIQRHWLVWMFETPTGIKSYQLLSDEEKKPFLCSFYSANLIVSDMHPMPDGSVQDKPDIPATFACHVVATPS